YGDWSAVGFFGQDTVSFGGIGTDQLSIPTTIFAQGVSINDLYTETNIDGVLGLAFTSIAVDGYDPPFINAINQGLVDQPIFTVYMKGVGGEDNVYGGTFTYGGLDTTNCGPVIAYQPLSSATFYQFTISLIASGSFQSYYPVQAMSDTASSQIVVSTRIANLIADANGAKYDVADDAFYIDCAATPSIDITIGDNIYTITSKNLVYPSGNKDGRCLFAIYGIEAIGFGIPDWRFGTPFIREYCNIFDVGQQRIGFAKSL
ncbi:unnamed protein product, partial [Heligmosomoides polygyrus]|uniref:Peptidase A1 domain-containing protein n=1 Tax=Heligmosomoides polygyrus TaxID=6339 RepID=A0A183G8H6_HELPZ